MNDALQTAKKNYQKATLSRQISSRLAAISTKHGYQDGFKVPACRGVCYMIDALIKECVGYVGTILESRVNCLLSLPGGRLL